MFGIENFFLFLVSGLLLNITPGPDMLYIATRSAAQGRRAGIVSALAIETGCLVHTVAAALGLSAVITYSALAFGVIKFAGAGYLIFLGVRIILSSGPVSQNQSIEEEPLGRIFRQGVTVNVLNPKVALFFLAFLPQFIDPSSGCFTWQIIFLGLVFIATGTLVNCFVAVFFGAAGDWFKGGVFRRARSWLSGSVFIGLGFGLAVSERG